ncbi:MAG TPA: response regulator [Ramlibacter sp.]|nr:response regulator [Ramlibacter sp.]
MTERELLAAKTGQDLSRAQHPPRLLIVDDDPLSRSMMDLMLTPHGCRLDFACDGAEAIRAIQSCSYDLVFLDLILPDMTGRDVCREVRQWEAGTRRLPIVAVTGLDLPGQPLELIKAGMDDYIFKPYDVRTLLRLIRLYTGGEDASPDAAEAGEAAVQPAVLDTSESLQDFADDVESYRELLSDFIGSLPGRLDKMQQAQRGGDLERLGREFHSLKGISAGLGALRLSRLSSRLCTALRNGEPLDTADALRRMEQGMHELQLEAQAFLSS